jgi:hypothetical protein
MSEISAAVAIARATCQGAAEEADKVLHRAQVDPSPSLTGAWRCDSLSAQTPSSSDCGCAGGCA